MESECCGQCGLPRWMCHDGTGGVQFRIEEDLCVVKCDIDVRHERDNKDEKKNHRITLLPSPYYVDGADHLSVRETYYKTLEERAKEREKDLREMEESSEDL